MVREYNPGDRVTVIPSVVDVAELKRDPRVTIAAVESSAPGRLTRYYWVTWGDRPIDRPYGPFSAMELLPGWNSR